VAERRWLFGLVGLALVVRLAICVSTGTAGVEAFEYDSLARNLLGGHGYVHHHLGTDYFAFYSGVPYVWLLAAGYALSGGSVVAALALQATASAALVAVIFSIGRRLGGPVTARVAAGLIALHPALAFYDTHKIHSLSFDALAIALAVLMLLRLRDGMDTGTALLAGAALGIAVLQRATMIAGPLIATAWLVAMRRRASVRWLRLGVAYGLGVLVIVTPLIVRNWMVLGTPLLSSVAAESLWRGNAPHSPGGSYLLSGQPVLDAASAVRGAVHGQPELRQAEIFREAFYADVASDPARFVKKVARKLLIFWWFAPESGITYPGRYFYIYASYYTAGVAFAVAGAASIVGARRLRPAAFETAMLLCATAVAVSLVQSIFYVEVRHRWGVEALLVVFAAVGLLRAWAAMGGVTPAMAEVSR
jgi:4-amino-4-deoxy-L-arabinose transferase-like glycosyltransferase